MHSGCNNNHYEPIKQNCSSMANMDVEIARKPSYQLKQEETIPISFWQRQFGCGPDINNWRERYTRATSAVWCMMTGPGSGVMFASEFMAHRSIDNIELVFWMSFVFFIGCVLTLYCPSSRHMVRLWIVVGLAWLGSAWFKYSRWEFGQDLENFANLTIVCTGLWSVTIALPLLLSDPWLCGWVHPIMP